MKGEVGTGVTLQGGLLGMSCQCEWNSCERQEAIDADNYHVTQVELCVRL